MAYLSRVARNHRPKPLDATRRPKPLALDVNESMLRQRRILIAADPDSDEGDDDGDLWEDNEPGAVSNFLLI